MLAAVKPLGSDDFSLIETLACRIWPSAYDGILSPEQIENILSKIYNPANLAQELGDGHRFWGAFMGAAALGFASGYRKGAVIWIKKLYVLPEAQGTGVGKLLLQAAIDGFSPGEEARLYVNGGNTSAQGFYVRQGFSHADTVKVRMGDYDFTDFIFAKKLV
ncbi:ribosomal protein S18 acetylase RimI-like enzyme [Rhizomicrobium palustre]|uniref:Ribosomal protein S18 acetylase RimI-like enzyme n=1 Tax=Rhizomicrobium palustre TaxID=189966 RepID=A0A846MUI9_9PROT|nr:GNAT family N-acetyltransferase [Rhizomicrobium palustre]NIK87178.1 ribosomal protein S18 acetylase RimI-like enzyme [Rhizomicrobium palustre]